MSADVRQLLEAVASVQEVDPVLLPGAQALERVRSLLEVVERLSAAVLPALRDVEDRGLWEHAAAGSTRGWLRTLPTGEAGWWSSAALLARRPRLSAALAAGTVALRTARVVAGALARVPADVEPEQLDAVLTDGAESVLRVWLGAACLRPTPEQEAEFVRRRARLSEAVAAGCAVPEAAPWVVLPEDRLEPVLTLLAEVLPPGDVAGAVDWLVDALQPEVVEAREERERSARELDLRHLPGGGWSLRSRLTEEAGQLLHDLLAAHRASGRSGSPGPHLPDAADRLFAELFGEPPASSGEPTPGRALAGQSAAGRGAGEQPDVDRVRVDPTEVDRTEVDQISSRPTADHPELPGRTVGREPLASAPPGATASPACPCGAAGLPAAPAADWGSTGPGAPALPSAGWHDLWADDPPVVQGSSGEPDCSFAQRQHDALLSVLRAVAGLPPGQGRPAPARLVLTATLEAAEGRAGALPGLLLGSGGAVTLSSAALRRAQCTSRLVGVVLDAAGRPVGASHEERDATPRERDALRAVWGDRCAVLGCTGRGAVPHHVVMHSRSGRTALEDLVPVCEPHHHDVHDGKKRLRLRDGRIVEEQGWAA